MPSWHTAGCPPPEHLRLYTDGFASFAVFAQVQGIDYFIGYAASVAAPPCSPYSLGEVVDDALTGELLAACWGLGWVAQFAPDFHVPVELLYDSQSAGGGVFGAF